MRFLTIILECGTVSGSPMLNVGQNTPKPMPCGDVIRMEIERSE